MNGNITEYLANKAHKETKYVLLKESDESVIMNYNDKNEAIQDAKTLQIENKLSCYIVCECVDNVYDIDNYIFKSSDLTGKF